MSSGFRALLAAALLLIPLQTAKALWSGNGKKTAAFATLLKISGQKQLDCSGVLIAPRLVLTAGHCMLGARAISARFGNEMITAENWIVNPKWSAGFPAQGWDARINASNSDGYIDLAVVLLSREPTRAKPVELTTSEMSDSGTMQTYGYARSRTLEPLYKIDSASASFQRRLSARGPFKFFASGGSAWCQGDSGGPLTRIENGSEKLVGIVGLGLGAIAYEPDSAVAMRWGGSDRAPKCGSYAYVQDVRMHAAWIAQASDSLLSDVPATASTELNSSKEQTSASRDR